MVARPFAIVCHMILVYSSSLGSLGIYLCPEVVVRDSAIALDTRGCGVWQLAQSWRVGY